MLRRLFGIGLLTVLVACGADGGTAKQTPGAKSAQPGGASNPDDPATIAKELTEKPWEVVSNKGETYLPNVFYADASQNEQIMPYAMDGHVMIDRLVYPTLGNPNLYTKSDANDEFVVVLRIEEAAYALLNPKVEPVDGSALSRLVIPTDASTGFGFFLIPRSARDPNTESTSAISSGNGTDVVRVYPNDIFVNPEPADMPATLKKRKTLRFVFKQGAMAKAPAGLYDVRMELKQNNRLYSPDANTPPIYEYQYNAIRVFDTEPDEYPVVNVTDTQVSVGSTYGTKTRDKLDEFVQFLNTSSDPAIKNAAFVTFNGDLHNGGSPGSLTEPTVATTYADEAKAIVSLLKYLPLPIFLTTGNHDGYVSTGHVPSAVAALDTGVGTRLRDVILDAEPKAWPDFSITDWDDYIAKTEASDQLGGVHQDIFTGSFARNVDVDGYAGWKELPRSARNPVLYDGFYQWQKSYGPLYYSHKFGKNFYVSLNSYELRQHRRAGWGMYTVNYGGGMSDVQMNWLDRELLRGKTDESDVVLLAHHDPRGGHQGVDPGYYFEQLEFRSVYQSAINYLVGQVTNPAVCTLPDWALPREQTDSCVHDGLQEWMRPDPELDCAWDKRKPDGTCPDSVPIFSSGVELMKRIAANGRVRTMVLGHTHYNALEVLQEGDELLPDSIPIDHDSSQKFATLEILNPMRGYSVAQSGGRLADYNHHALKINTTKASLANFVDQYQKSVNGWSRTLSSPMGPRELVILRIVSNADLTDQTYSTGKDALGFSVLFLNKKTDVRGVDLPQINSVKFYANVGEALYNEVGTINIDRTTKFKPHDPNNPVQMLYDW